MMERGDYPKKTSLGSNSSPGENKLSLPDIFLQNRFFCTAGKLRRGKMFECSAFSCSLND